MTREKLAKARPPTHIHDARGKKVTQLDPVELRLLHRHDVIDTEALRPIVEEVGSGMEERSRRFVPVLTGGVIIIAIVLGVQIIDYAIQGDMLRALTARNIALANVWLLILILWTCAKQARFGRAKTIMLKYRRCPHCGYDLHGLTEDPQDSSTVCPECGCAWKLGGG